MNENSNIIESSNSNIFLWLNQKIITPPLSSGCIAGIMRKVIINILIELNIEIVERDITQKDLEMSNEIFLTNVISGITWVGGFKHIRYYNTLSKKITKKLNENLIVDGV